MKSRKKIFLLGGLALLLILFLWWMQAAQKPVSLPTTSKPSASEQSTDKPNTPEVPQVKSEKNKAVIKQIENAFAAPIAFYGRVIDQNGNPVAGASVDYSPIDNFRSSATHYTGLSDAGGYFSIKDIQGIALSVGVDKRGYYPVADKYDKSPSSSATFAYGMGPDSYRQSPPTKDKPAIFVLQKMGETVPLVYRPERQYKVPKNGEPVEIDLETGRQVQKGNIRFERWANDQSKNEKGRFDWSFKISVPNGGIIERKGDFDFEEPGGGYEENADISMPTSLGDKWQYTVKKGYFLKLPEGNFARLNVTIFGGHNNSLVLESFLNPTPGDRNLEFDPAKAVTVP